MQYTNLSDGSHHWWRDGSLSLWKRWRTCRTSLACLIQELIAKPQISNTNPVVEGQEEAMHSLGPFLSLPCHFGICIPSPLCHRQNLRRPQECQELYWTALSVLVGCHLCNGAPGFNYVLPCECFLTFWRTLPNKNSVTRHNRNVFGFLAYASLSQLSLEVQWRI